MLLLQRKTAIRTWDVAILPAKRTWVRAWLSLARLPTSAARDVRPGEWTLPWVMFCMVVIGFRCAKRLGTRRNKYTALLRRIHKTTRLSLPPLMQPVRIRRDEDGRGA